MKRISESLSHLSHIKVGDLCENLFFPENYDDIYELYYQNKGKRIFPLGGGSNVLFGKVEHTLVLSDKYLPWKYSVEDDIVQVSANHNINYILKKSASLGLGGLSFLAGIPAHVGGLCFMNAGAYGKSLGDYVVWIKIIDHEGLKVVRKDQIDFRYRYSGINGFITEVALKFQEIKKDIVLKQIIDQINLRREKQPLNSPNLGCFFKNPDGYSAGQLIDQLGFKGYRVNDAMVSVKHANFLINTGSATYKDFETLIHVIQEKVFKEFGFHLELEVKVINES